MAIIFFQLQKKPQSELIVCLKGQSQRRQAKHNVQRSEQEANQTFTLELRRLSWRGTVNYLTCIMFFFLLFFFYIKHSACTENRDKVTWEIISEFWQMYLEANKEQGRVVLQ